MATTSTQLREWLKKGNNRRCVLVEVGVFSGSEITRYVSNMGYTTKSTDVPANTLYTPLVSGGVSFNESISLDGSVTVSTGAIEFNNVDGSIDSWMKDVWKNRKIKVFIGDYTWQRSDFYQIFEGVVDRMECNDRDSLTLVVSDKLQRLNTTLSDVKLGGTGQNADKLVPWLFGEAFNISPVLTNLATHEYQISGGAIERIIEVRDNGIPVAFTPDLANGKFTLNQQPFGTITCDAQGDKSPTYTSNVTQIIKRLVKDFGNTDSSVRFTDADLDLTSLNAFAAANTQPVGLYLTEKANLLECCNKLASSIGARVAMTRAGLLYLVKLHLPQLSPGTLVTAADIKERSIYVSEMPEVVASVKVGYCKNNTVQETTADALPADQQAMYKAEQEWLTATSVNEAVAAQYKLLTNPTMIETQLIEEASANAESDRLRDMWSVQRSVVGYDGFPHLLLETLGSPQTIQHKRFDLSAGVTGQIVSITSDWLKADVQIGVLL